jgi:polar amino acid transport system substrate-binding protein
MKEVSMKVAMKKVPIFLFGVILALSAVLLAGCSASSYTPQTSEQKVDNSLLHSAGTLRVGVNASNAPYAAESNGSIVGIDVDIAAALADELGLKLELVDVGTSADQAFSSEDVDIVMGVGSDAKNCWVSDPYLSSSITLFSITETAQAPSADASYKVAAQASSMSAVEITNRLGQDHLEATTDIQTAFDQLKSGSVDYIATDSTIGSYVAHSNGLTIYPVAFLSDETRYCIGVPTTATGLQNAVKDALKSISDGGVLKVIEQKWLGTQLDFGSLTVIEAPAAEEDEAEDESTTTTTTSTSTSRASSSSSSSNTSSN